jgi:hypothetical protein
MSNRPRGGAAGVQPPRRRRRSPRVWTKRRRAAFLETLAESCNVNEAARVAKMDRSSAYDLKDRDPEFQRGWGKALEQAHSALEWDLLKDAKEGSVRTEMTIDPETKKPITIKLTRSPAHTVAIRLYLSHKAEVRAFRVAEAAIEEARGVAESEWAWLEKIDARLAKVEHVKA